MTYSFLDRDTVLFVEEHGMENAVSVTCDLVRDIYPDRRIVIRAEDGNICVEVELRKDELGIDRWMKLVRAFNSALGPDDTDKMFLSRFLVSDE
jgi:hypothetical protein